MATMLIAKVMSLATFTVNTGLFVDLIPDISTFYDTLDTGLSLKSCTLLFKPDH